LEEGESNRTWVSMDRWWIRPPIIRGIM